MPTTFSPQERAALLNALRQGRQNAIKAEILARTLGYPTGGNQVRLRTLIKECIEVDLDPIGAATGRPAGYFKILNISELEIYVDSLGRRIRKDNDRRSALINGWNNIQNNTNTNRQLLSIT